MKPIKQNTADTAGARNSTATRQAKLPSMNEGSLRFAFASAPIGMAIVNLDYRIHQVNQALCNALGYPENELLERRFTEITHQDDVEKDQALAEKLLRGELPSYRFEKRFLKKDGTLAWLDLTALVIRDEANNPLYGFAMVEDITERKRSQEALRTSEERYRSFIVNSSEGIWRLEVECPINTSLPADEQISLFYKHAYIAECNDAMARMHGYDRADDIVGMSYGDFAKSLQPTSIGSLKKLIASGYRLMNVNREQLESNGSKRYFNSSLIGIVINGSLLRVWGVHTDQTDQHRAELALEHSHHQLRELTAYLQTIREKERVDLAREMHDVLGQSLTGLNIEVSLLRKKLAQSQSIDRDAIDQELTEIGKQLNETLSSVKSLSTELRPGVLDQFGLVAAIEWQSEEFTRRYNIECECDVPQAEVNLRPELATALFRILQEALINVARHSQADHVMIRLTTDDSFVSLTIADNGTGITVDRIEDPTSLGLLGMSERVEFLGGRFTISGVDGKGTTLSVRAPFIKPTVPQSGIRDD